MLGIIGFGIGAILVGAYAARLRLIYHKVDKNITRSISLGFGSLALAMLIWQAVVGLSLEGRQLEAWLVAANILLLFGTAQMLSLLTQKTTASLAFWLIASSLIALKLTVYESQAVVVDGLLHFNVSGMAYAVFVSIFAFIWLPACLIFAKRIQVSYPAMHQLNSVVYWLFVILVVMCGLFMVTQRPVMIITSFIALLTTFAALLTAGVIHLRTVKQLIKA